MCSDKHYSRLPTGRGLGRDPPVSDLPEAQWGAPAAGQEASAALPVWRTSSCAPIRATCEPGCWRRSRVCVSTADSTPTSCTCKSGTPHTHTARKYWTTPGWHNSLSNRLGSFLGASSAYFFLSILSIYLLLKYYMLKLLKLFNVHILVFLFKTEMQCAIIQFQYFYLN